MKTLRMWVAPRCVAPPLTPAQGLLPHLVSIERALRAASDEAHRAGYRGLSLQLAGDARCLRIQIACLTVDIG